MPTHKTEPSALLIELTTDLKPCRMCQVLEKLPASEKDALLLVVKKMREKNATQHGRSQHTYSYAWLANVLTKHGFPLERKDVRNYVTGKCEC